MFTERISRFFNLRAPNIKNLFISSTRQMLHIVVTVERTIYDEICNNFMYIDIFKLSPAQVL